MNDRSSPVAGMSDIIADMAYVRGVVLRAQSSFAIGMKVLPADRRDAMFAVYAFCREVDDIADGSGSPQEKLKSLNDWRVDIAGIYKGLPRGAICRALTGVVKEFGLREVDFLAVIDGMEMDAATQVRLSDMDELHLYCDRVACAVGRLSVRIFGMEAEAGDALAKALGEALQLTNILRDLHEDAIIDRLYLPIGMLRAHGIEDAGDAHAVLRQPGLAAVCDSIAQLAQRRYSEAEQLVRRAPRRQVLPAILMMRVYERVLSKLKRRGWRDVSQRLSLSRPEKLWIALRYGPLGW